MLNSTIWTNPLRVIFPQKDLTSITEITDHVALVRGSHTLKTGINVRLMTVGRETSAGIYPNVFLASSGGNPPASLGPSGPSISPADRQRFEQFYNHLLGHIGTVQQTFYSDLEQFQLAGTPRARHYRNREYHGFLQDDWKLRRNLTLSLGIRYEWNGPPFERNRLQGTVDRASEISRSSQFSDLTIMRTRRWFGADGNNLAPRFGIAWDPRGDGKTAVRTSFGIYYDALANGAITFADANTPGFAQPVQVMPNLDIGRDIRLSDGIPVPPQPAAPLLRPPPDRGTNIISIFDPDLRTGYVQQYSVSVQRELARHTVVEAAFVGSRGVKLFMQVNPNQRKVGGDFLEAFRQLQTFRSNGVPVPPGNTLVRLFGSVNAAVTGIGTAFLDRGETGAAADNVDRNRSNFSRYPAAGIPDYYIRNFPQFNLLIQGTNEGRSYYDSLQVSLRRRSGPVTLDLNYTWSKSIDTVSSEGESFDAANVPIDSFNLRLNRARSDADRPHVLTGLGVCALPIGKGRRLGGTWPRWLDLAAGGWDVGVLAIWESGGVFTVRSGRQTAGASVPTFANFSGDRSAGVVERRGDGVFWFSADEIRRFSFPAAGEIGTSGRNTFRGPRFFNVDLSLVKTFRVSEQHRLVFRVETYNLFNNVNFANPEANLATPAALGRIGSTPRGITGAPLGEPSGGPRIMQFALRWEF